MTQKILMLVKTESKANSNKFYEVKLEEDNTVHIRYGRVGQSGVTGIKGSGQYAFDKVVREKKAKGYNEVDIAINNAPNGKSSQDVLSIAIRDILGENRKENVELVSLIKKLTEINKHEIMNASGGKISIKDGVISTEVGPLNVEGIKEARDILEKIQKNPTNDSYQKWLDLYLMKVPQKVPSRGNWYDGFFDGKVTTFDKQFSFLEQLETSIKNYTPVQETDGKVKEKVFGFTVDLLTDEKEFKRLKNLFESGRNSMHVTKNLKVKRIFVLHNEEHEKRFEEVKKNIGNVKMLWHGSMSHNILSILKSGLIVPKNYTNGFMFGPGIYHANINCSTKSANYSYGYWSGQRKTNECFVFLNEVALGKEYLSKNSFPRKHGQYDNIEHNETRHKGYNSTVAYPGNVPIQNDEFIVPKAEQVNLKYLFELYE